MLAGLIINGCEFQLYHGVGCEFYSHQVRGVLETTLHDTVVSNLQRGFLQVLHFPSAIKLTAMI